jgi:hypothetical protein
VKAPELVVADYTVMNGCACGAEWPESFEPCPKCGLPSIQMLIMAKLGEEDLTADQVDLEPLI